MTESVVTIEDGVKRYGTKLACSIHAGRIHLDRPVGPPFRPDSSVKTGVIFQHGDGTTNGLQC